MLWTLPWIVGAIATAVALLYVLFGPGVERHHPRAQMPLRDIEKQFLEQHVADGKEHTGYLHRPRPRNQVVRIFYRYWQPKHVGEDAVKGVVVVLHGMNSHSARNNSFMVELLQSGFVIAGLDLEGFGRSDGRHGYFESLDHLVDDAIELIKHSRQKYKGRKVFLHGGSLGGLLTISVLLKIQKTEKHLVDGAVILCPAVQIHARSRPSATTERVGKLLRQLAPKLPIASGQRGKNSSPEVAAIVDALKREDPMFYNGKMRIGTGLALLDAINALQNRYHEIETPYLLQHGLADFVCHISGSETFHSQTSSKDKEFRSYPDAAHDLSNEPPRIRNAVVQDFVQWLEDRA